MGSPPSVFLPCSHEHGDLKGDGYFSDNGRHDAWDGIISVILPPIFV